MSRETTGGRIRPGLLLALALLALLVTAMAGWLDFNRFAQSPLHVAGPDESVDVSRGSSFRDIVSELHRRDASTANWIYWRLLAGQMRVAGRLHAGEYALPAGITPRTLLSNMATGKVLQRNFTIVDGWTFAELRQALDKAVVLKHETRGLDDASVMQRIGAAGEMPEGRFLPETYAYVKGDSDLDLLGRAHQAMVRMLGTLWPLRDKDLPLATSYDALILASIVEKETGRADERARIAGVFVRRLQDHMLLQTDPSVIYGMGSRYDGKIHKSDLMEDTPYNTYTRPGLPPTPIAMPGKPALQAALHPEPGDDLYFVARGDGGHVFASSLEEHNRHVDCYQRKHCQ